MIRDKSENLGVNSRTKLLDDKENMGNADERNCAIPLVKTANNYDENIKKAAPLAVNDLTQNFRCEDKSDKVLNGEDNIALAAKESFFNTFQRRLRRSIKAVSESPGPITRYRQTRFSSRRVRKRVVFKHGECNVVQGNVAKRRRRYLQDIFTTLVDAQWRWTLLVFALSFLISWAFFAMIWWMMAYSHGDLEYIYQRENDPDSVQNVTHRMCVTEIRSLVSAFLYSIETQHTIGYGNRFVTEECPEAIFTMCLQCITGVFIQAFMVGIVFAKLSRPKKRAQTLLFSRNAVICHRDGVPCLMFRVGDMRKSHIIEAHVRAQVIRKKVTKEGEVLPFFQQELKIGADGGEDRLMFIWPTTIVHKIDRHSPLYMLSASDMLKERFEVVCMLEGVIESTGMTTQARTSYLPSEILWGHRFVNVVSFRKETGEYEVDYTLFNNTYDVDTPLCSSKQLDDVKTEYAKNTRAGYELALATGLHQYMQSTASVDHLDPASDESLYSERVNTRSNSIQHGCSVSELQPLTQGHNSCGITFTVGGASISPSPYGTSSNLQSINEKTSSGNSSTSTLNNESINNNNHHIETINNIISNTNNKNNNNLLNHNNNLNTINNNNNNNNNNKTISTTNTLPTLTVSSASNNNNNNNNNNSINNNNNKPKAITEHLLSVKKDHLPIDSLC